MEQECSRHPYSIQCNIGFYFCRAIYSTLENFSVVSNFVSQSLHIRFRVIVPSRFSMLRNTTLSPPHTGHILAARSVFNATENSSITLHLRHPLPAMPPLHSSEPLAALPVPAGGAFDRYPLLRQRERRRRYWLPLSIWHDAVFPVNHTLYPFLYAISDDKDTLVSLVF